MPADPQFVLTLSCTNRPGIVAAVAVRLLEVGCNILEAQQYDDLASGRFFMRVVFNPATAATPRLEALQESFAPVAAQFGMLWTLRDARVPRRVLVLVSKPDHCLADLLYRHRIGELPMELVAIASNHSASIFCHLDWGEVPFHHLPVTPLTKLEQEAALWELIRSAEAELVVLARYMQVLSGEIG